VAVVEKYMFDDPNTFTLMKYKHERRLLRLLPSTPICEMHGGVGGWQTSLGRSYLYCSVKERVYSSKSSALSTKYHMCNAVIWLLQHQRDQYLNYR